jgi:hypothetical protein
MPRPRANQPAGSIIDRLSQFVELLNQARDYHARERLTPFVRMAMEEYPFIATIVLQPPANIIKQLKMFAPTVASSIINEAEAEKIIAGLQERLRQPAVEYVGENTASGIRIFKCSEHGKFFRGSTAREENVFDQKCPLCNPEAYSSTRTLGGK